MTITISTPSPDAVAFVRPSKLNVLIVDVSGSMGWALEDLRKDTIERVNAIPEGDAVLIGVFSSQGYYKWIVARELSGQSDKEFVATAIRRDMTIYGMTCFSEILGDFPQAIRPFLAKFPVVGFTFMSDGRPNAWPIDRELEAVFANLEALKGYLTSALVVAYGDYADRNLLGRMAKTVGGELVTAQRISDVGEAFARNTAGKARKRRRVKAPEAQPVVAFSIDSDNSVTTLTVENGEYSVADSARVVVLESFEGTAEQKPQDAETLDYAAALALLGEARIDDATKLMSAVGDVAIVNALNTAITNAELAKGEEMIRKAIADPGERFTKGRQVGCLPPDDAFDLIDTLELLQGVKECRFFPRHPAFVYKRIGPVAKPLPGYPKFQADPSVAVKFSKLVGNQKELNLSVMARIPGTVELPDEVTPNEDGVVLKREDLGLPKTFPTFVFRNYAVVANAMLSVPYLPAELSEAAFATLQKAGVVGAGEFYEKHRVYVLDLTAVPACNKARGKEAADWDAIAKAAVRSLELGSMIKVIKAKRNELDPELESKKPVEYTHDQLVFLEKCGVGSDGSFSPPTEKQEPIDVVDVLLFETKVKGGSSVSIKDFELMAKGDKNMNYVGGLMLEGKKEIDSQMPSTKGAAIEWCNKRMAELLKEQRAIDAEINARRYAVALGGHWARHFSEDEATFKVGKPEAPTLVTLSFRKAEKKL